MNSCYHFFGTEDDVPHALNLSCVILSSCSLSEWLTMKEELCAVTLAPCGDWSHWGSGECLSVFHKKSVCQPLVFHLWPPVCSWSGGHIKWGQSFRIRHITTGRYLLLDEEKGLLLVDAEKANSKMSAFCFRISKVVVTLKQLRRVSCPRLQGTLTRLSCTNTGENWSGPEARRGGDGNPWDQVRRVHVLRAACFFRTVAHLCCSGRQVSTSGSPEEKGKANILPR